MPDSEDVISGKLLGDRAPLDYDRNDMTAKTINDSPVWKQFETEARKRRRNPVSFALDLMKEQIEIWEDESLDREISREAQKSGYTEDDAVDLVRRYRREKRVNAGA